MNLDFDDEAEIDASNWTYLGKQTSQAIVGDVPCRFAADLDGIFGKEPCIGPTTGKG